MKTQNRKEIFLKALANGEEPNIKPLTREEVLLKKQAERESAGGGGDCDWNLMKNKPFGETVIEWDGNTEGLENVAGMFYKVSDLTPSKEELIGGYYDYIGNGSEFNNQEITSDLFVEFEHCYIMSEGVIVATQPTTINLGADVTIPSAGVYFACGNSTDGKESRIKKMVYRKTIDPKYLPVDYIKQLIAEVTS